MTGGVAQNKGVVKELSRELNLEVKVPPHPQMTGALGAALLAYEQLEQA
jgi:activator of 2-hydroxyglutaryl-CoA dehydratase